MKNIKENIEQVSKNEEDEENKEKENIEENNHTLDWMFELAKNKSGKCLSNIFLGPENNYLWKCQLGHVFIANCYDAEKKWCLECSTK